MSPARPTVYALVAGGGTGGHVYPGLAVADALVERGHAPGSIRFLGAVGRLEADAVPAAGYSIDLLPVRGFRRGRTTPALAGNVRLPFTMAAALARAVGLLRRLRPQVVVGVGGYASVPGVMAARLLGIPVVVHEQNAVPGLANRVAARLGAAVAVSFPGTGLPGARVVGNPVRASLATIERAPDRDRPLLGVVGGSLGSARLNDAALDLYDRWRARVDVQVRHVAGRLHYDECRSRLDRLQRTHDLLVYELVPYEDHMDRLYGRASLAVCRAGAVTVVELAAAGVPSVLVPWPGAADDHQTDNARVMADAGAAVLLADAQVDGARLDEVTRDLLLDATRLRSMSDAARALAHPDAADRLADLVEETARARA